VIAQSEPHSTPNRQDAVFPGAVMRFVHGRGFQVAEPDRRAPTVVQVAAEGIVASAGGRLTFHNGPARRMLGPAVEDVNPLLWVNSLHVEHRGAVLDALDAAAAGDHRDSMTAAVDDPDGETRWLRIETMPAFDARGAHVGFAATLLDTTDEHTAQEAARRTEEQVWRTATLDHLTGLPNRSHFNDRFDRALARTRHDGPPPGVLLCDLDHFRQVNQRYGRVAADALLAEVADRLTGAVRDTDTVCRLGGDAFVILCEAFDDLESLEALGRRLIDAINQPVRLGDSAAPATVGICVGIAAATTTSTADEVLAAADAAVQQAKRNGRNGYVTSGSKFTLFGTKPAASKG
jgi:diguanylate cyclase (GGDEF)-like protein/PAS domain S-box-containing protein